MRAAVLVALALIASPGLAFADKSVAGNWTADLGEHEGKAVSIVMSVTEDGNWASKTIQGDQSIAAMSGTYKQTTTSPTSGTLVFTPTKAETSTEHGTAEVETDQYTVGDGTLNLTSDGDTMVFHKQ